MPVTLKKLAEYADVSTATVSLALKNDSRVAEKTREKINDLAAQTGYIPSHFGRALQARRSQLVAYLLPAANISFYQDLIQGVANTLTEAGYGLMVGFSGEDAEIEEKHLRLFREKQIDGLIISYYHPASVKTLNTLEKEGCPLVFCDYADISTSSVQVKVDDLQAVTEVCEHLVGLGHTNIIYGFCRNENSHSRFRECARFMQERQLPPPTLCETEDQLRNLFSSQNHGSAFVAYSDRHAIQVIQMAREIGWRVPEDLSVVGFDDLEEAAWPEFSLTTIHQPKIELGEKAAGVLLNQLKGEQVSSMIIPPVLIKRNSTALPRTDCY